MITQDIQMLKGLEEPYIVAFNRKTDLIASMGQFQQTAIFLQNNDQ